MTSYLQPSITLLQILALCEGNLPFTGGFPSQKASIQEGMADACKWLSV